MSREKSPAKLRKPLLNRVVGHGTEQVDQLLAHPDNARIHTEQQQQALAGAIDDIGYIHPVIVNRVTGRILDGHLRVTLALRSGVDALPVDYVELDEADEAKALLMLDPIAAMAATDREKLDVLLRSVQSGDERVQALMADIAEREGLEYGKPAPVDDPGEVAPDRFEEVARKWNTADGQLWALGEHRILCADSLSAENVKRLMGNDAPALIIADPPYGVSIVAANGYVGGGEAYNIPFGGRKGFRGSDGASKPFGSKAVRGTDGAAHVVDAGKYPVVIGDESADTAEQAVVLYCEMFPDAVQVWWGANYYSPVLPASQCWVVWNKETTGNFADCELAWTNQDKAAKLFTHKWNGMLRDSERERRWHPTQKPAALAAWVCNEFTEAGAIVLDPFGGAGWALLACEQTGRKARVIEKSHEYIAVILERWSQATGKTPVLLEAA